MVSITVLDIAILVFLAAVAVISSRRGFAVTSCSVVGHLISILFGIIAAAVATPALITAVKASAGASLQEQLGLALPESAAAMSGEIAAAMLRALEASVLRPMMFAIGYLFFLALWHYGCLYFALMDFFPSGKPFDQLYGLGLGLLKGMLLTATALYVLTSLGIVSTDRLSSSLLLGKLWSIWRGIG